jgi:hypothetical protein
MKRIELSDMTTMALVDRFAEIGVAQGQALLRGEHGKFNRLFALMDDVSKELKQRDGDRRMLQTIADSNWMPQAGDAGMSLSNLDRGVFKPT